MRDAAETITAQLEALASQDYTGAWEVIVADNGSSDASADLAAQWKDRLPALRVIDASVRRGASHARNAALREARGEAMALCDADDIVDSRWLTGLASAIDASDLVGGCVDFETLTDPKKAVKRPHQSSGLLVDLDFLPYAIGCNCAVRVAVARSLGGWNEEYERGGEDVEFSWRAQLAGHSIGFAPDALVYRRPRTSAGDLARQFYGFGDGQVRLFRQFRDVGVVRQPSYRVVSRWLFLAASWWVIVGPRWLRRRWVRTVALSAGRVAGSVRHRVVFL